MFGLLVKGPSATWGCKLFTSDLTLSGLYKLLRNKVLYWLQVKQSMVVSNHLVTSSMNMHNVVEMKHFQGMPYGVRCHLVQVLVANPAHVNWETDPLSLYIFFNKRYFYQILTLYTYLSLLSVFCTLRILKSLCMCVCNVLLKSYYHFVAYSWKSIWEKTKEQKNVHNIQNAQKYHSCLVKFLFIFQLFMLFQTMITVSLKVLQSYWQFRCV